MPNKIPGATASPVTTLGKPLPVSIFCQPAQGSPPAHRNPPLPHHLQTSGVGWLVTAVVLAGTRR